MVVILQQTTDNGKRFVSTVVEDEVSLTSGFSGLSSNQNSISERSAIYKQRIDSLFSIIPKSSQVFTSQYFPKPLITCIGSKNINYPKEYTKIINKTTDSSEDEGYQRIDEEMDNELTSLVPDSLNLRKDIPCVRNVSMVKLNSDFLNDPSSNFSSSSEEIGHTWKNGTYSNIHCQIDSSQEIQARENIEHRFPSSSGILRFSVEYLGCVPVEGNTTTLQELQIPLRSLYLNFLTSKNVMGGQLSITGEEFRFDSSTLRIVNPFNTISVWAAIKFVARGKSVPIEYAFMPLISDPEGQDKRRLFGIMDPEFSKIYLNSINGFGFRNPPIFACIMREASFKLQCHAFTCKCAEDAIVIAANLYQCLVNKMKIHKEGESGYGTLTRTSTSPATTHQNSPTGSRDDQKRILSCTSAQGNIVGQNCCGNKILKSNQEPKKQRVNFSDSDSLAPPRPPRRKKKYGEITSGQLKRFNSDESLHLKIPHHRLKSFKVHSHSSQRRYPRTNKKRVKITTPDEIAESGANESIDKILDRIINPGGMSFNDLKPTYQDLLLKIALTLTQDQLYKKSKEAMKKQQETSSNKSEEHFLGNLLKPFSRISSAKGGPFGMKKDRRKPLRNPLIGGSKLKVPKVILKKRAEEDKFLSICSGCMCENCSEKCYCSLPSKQSLKTVGLPSVTPSADCNPAYMQKKRLAEINEANKKSKPTKIGKKGCGYDTDSCAESEKCYCSLQGVKSNGLKIYNINLDTETSDTDTNSYDLESFNQNSVAQSSANDATFSRPVEILSYHPAKRFPFPHSTEKQFHSTQATKTNAVVHQSKSNLGLHQDVIYPKAVENVAKPLRSGCLDEGRSSPSLRQRKKVLLITGSTPSTQLVYREETLGGEERRKLGDILEVDALEGSEIETSRRDSEESIDSLHVLEMKKTAEIEAMFTNMRLHKNRREMNVQQTSSSQRLQGTNQKPMDFQASLGYLP